MRSGGPYRSPDPPRRVPEPRGPTIDREALAVLAVGLLTLAPPLLDCAAGGGAALGVCVALLALIAGLLADTLRDAAPFARRKLGRPRPASVCDRVARVRARAASRARRRDRAEA